MLWARDAKLADAINAQHLSARYLPAIELPHSLMCTANLSQALAHAQRGTAPGLLILGVPLAGLRALCEQLAEQLAIAPLTWSPLEDRVEDQGRHAANRRKTRTMTRRRPRSRCMGCTRAMPS